MRHIIADVKKEAGLLDRSFRFCVSASRAYLLLRHDHMEHLKTVHEECGFRYVRFHGLLQDDMGIYRRNKSGEILYSWQYCDQVYDHILQIGMKPFVVFDFMPEALASGSKTIYWEKSNITPPFSYQEWYELVYRVTRHFTERYGEEEVKQWYFEIWNEPDGFFFDGSQAEYFKLYENAARAVKAVCSEYAVGGPSAAGQYGWLADLAGYCDRNHVPLDFVTAHTYCLEDFEKGKSSDADRKIPVWNPGTPWPLSNHRLNTDIAIGAVDKCLQIMGECGYPDKDIHFTEWGLTFCYWDPLHDSYRAPSHMLHVLKKSMHKVKCMSFCEVSDVFEEDGPPTDHFHGGFGLLNLQGIRKPSFFAYRFLNMLDDTELVCNDNNTIICKSARGYQVLTWDCGNSQDEENILYYGRNNPPCRSEDVSITLHNIDSGYYRVKRYAVGYRKNDAYTAFDEMQYEDSLSVEQVKELKLLSNGVPDEEYEMLLIDGTYFCSFEMRENDVYLFMLEKM